MTTKQIKKKHNIPLSEDVFHLSIDKLENEIKSGDTKKWECWLRQPLVTDLDLILYNSDRPYTSVRDMIDLLFIDGDIEFKTKKRLIKSSMKIKEQILQSYNSVESTRTVENELQHIIDITISEDKKLQIILRDPTLEEEENLIMMLSDRPVTATQMALQSLYIEGDLEITNDPKLILSCLNFFNTIISNNEIDFEKK